MEEDIPFDVPALMQEEALKQVKIYEDFLEHTLKKDLERVMAQRDILQADIAEQYLDFSPPKFMEGILTRLPHISLSVSRSRFLCRPSLRLQNNVELLVEQDVKDFKTKLDLGMHVFATAKVSATPPFPPSSPSSPSSPPAIDFSILKEGCQCGPHFPSVGLGQAAWLEMD